MQSYEWLRFFDHYLKGIDTGLETEKRLYYFTVGEERWKATSVSGGRQPNDRSAAKQGSTVVN